jgi:hypothetical protein
MRRYTLTPTTRDDAPDPLGATLAIRDWGRPVAFFTDVESDTALDRLNELQASEESPE